MKIAILGSPERKEKDLPLIREAKEVFETSLYVPIDGVKLGIEEEPKAWYKKTDLSEFDCILPIPISKNREFFYTCLRILEENVYLPISSDKFFILWKKPLLLKLFSQNNIEIRRTFVVASDVATGTILEELKLPVIITPPSEKRVLATKKETLKNILSLFKPGYTIVVEKPIKPESVIWTFVVGDEVVASYEKKKSRRRAIKLGEELENLAVKVRKIISSDFCGINFIKTKSHTIVNNVTLSPNFSLFQEVTGKNISRILLSYLKERVKESKKGLLDRFIDTITEFLKQVSR
jgi:glutathione synthase/RimK-type ligase-like ATP-grasp enzyme